MKTSILVVSLFLAVNVTTRAQITAGALTNSTQTSVFVFTEAAIDASSGVASGSAVLSIGTGVTQFALGRRVNTVVAPQGRSYEWKIKDNEGVDYKLTLYIGTVTGTPYAILTRDSDGAEIMRLN